MDAGKVDAATVHGGNVDQIPATTLSMIRYCSLVASIRPILQTSMPRPCWLPAATVSAPVLDKPKLSLILQLPQVVSITALQFCSGVVMKREA